MLTSNRITLRIMAVCSLILLGCMSLSAQNIAVKGKVTDKNGETIVGAYVLIQGTRTGTSTNLDGEYSLNVPSNGTLVFSSMGFKSETVKVNGRAIINVVLSEDADVLESATVTAEFGMKRVARSVGSAVQNVKASDITESGRESFVSALAGRVAGMTVTSTSGSPGASTSVVLRSITSISGSNQPLYVVDGIPMNNSTFYSNQGFATDDGVSTLYLDFASRGNEINPEDIESMTVLKGAAAAALYGSDASNGAIVITTKKGSAGRGKVSYNNSFRWDFAYGYPELQTKYANGAYGVTNYYYTSHFGGSYAPDVKLYDNIAAILQTGTSQTHNIAVEGGTDKVTIRGSASYLDQQGVVKTTSYDKLNITLTGKAQITKWLNFDASIQYVTTNNSKVSKGTAGPLYRACLWPMTDDMSRYENADGTMSRPTLYTDTDLLNPLYALYKNKNFDHTDRAITSVMVNVTPTKHTYITARMGWDFSFAEYQSHTHPYYGNPTSGSYGKGSYNIANNNYIDKSYNVIAGYSNQWGKFNFDAFVGYHQTENNSNTLSSYGSNFQVIDFYSLQNCEPSTIISRQRHQNERLQALSASLSLGWNNMAFLTLRGRNDWSSTLMPLPTHSYFYPAGELSFVATELPFMQNQTAVSYLKLRGAIAQVGKGADPYSIYPSLEATEDWGGGYRYGYTGPNEALKPEMTTSEEVGFEGRFLNDRINADFTYFWTKCEDQYITSFRLSYATGFVLNNMNVGTFTTNGWELHVDGDILRTSGGLHWNVGANLSHSTSLVTYLPENVTEYYNAYTWLSGNLRNGIQVGYPVTSMTGQAYQRNKKGQILIDPSTGIPLTESTWSYLGDRQPKLELGFNTYVSWKGFRLSALVNGQVGATVVNATKRTMMTNGLSWESVALRESDPVIFDGVLKNGLEETDQPTINTIAVTFANYGSSIYTGGDEQWLEKDVNYFRLAEVRLSYNVPAKWLERNTSKFLSAANVWVKGTDLYTWTNYSGIDPVGNSNSAALGGSGGRGIDCWGIPNPRGVAFGVSLTF